MAKLKDLTSGNYITKDDLPAQGASVRLERLELQEMPEQEGRGQESKYVAFFAGKVKGMVMNKTNLGTLQDMGLEDTDDIPADFPSIHLYFDASVSFAGKKVGGLRIKPIVTEPAPPPPSDDDDVPF